MNPLDIGLNFVNQAVQYDYQNKKSEAIEHYTKSLIFFSLALQGECYIFWIPKDIFYNQFVLDTNFQDKWNIIKEKYVEYETRRNKLAEELNLNPNSFPKMMDPNDPIKISISNVNNTPITSNTKFMNYPTPNNHQSYHNITPQKEISNNNLIDQQKLEEEKRRNQELKNKYFNRDGNSKLESFKRIWRAQFEFFKLNLNIIQFFISQKKK